MGLRVGVNMRSYRFGRDELADAWVAHAAPALARALAVRGDRAVFLTPPLERGRVPATQAEVREVEPVGPSLAREALDGLDVLLCPLGGFDPADPPLPAATPELRLAPRPEVEERGDARAFAALGLPPDYVLAAAHEDHAFLLDTLPDNRHLVLVGGSLAGADALRRRADALGIGARVRLAGLPPARVRGALLRGAQAVVHCVREHAFPLAALEAMAARAPLMVERGTPAAALAGDAAQTVERDATAVAAVLSAAPSGERLDLGARRAADHSWAAIGRDLATLAGELASRRVEVRREPPRVSVVTPTLNMARFLRQTVDSVLSQDYPHLDYLVMDGGSTDGTVELLRSYGERLRFVSGPDGGQGDAVNRGFKDTSGHVFAFLNADDTYRAGAVAAAARGFLERPGAGVVYGDGVHVDEHGRELAPYPTRDFDPDSLSRRCIICQPAAFMARPALERVGLLDPSLRVALDWDLWIRLARDHRFARIPGVLATSRMHEANKTLGERRVLYREGAQLLRRHYGYVPLEWLHGQAQFLLQGVDQFYARSRPNAASRALALALAVGHNPRRLGRVLSEWATDAGLRDYSGRWEDGWISRRFVEEVDVPQACERVRVEARHQALIPEPLEVSVHLDGTTVARARRREHGSFELVGECPPRARGRRARLEIVANRTWRPRARGDRRRISCVIDSVELA